MKAGDKIIIYMGAHSGEDNLVLEYQGAAGTQTEKHPYEKVFTKHVFVAQYSGTYKIWTEGTAKTAFNRVVRIPGVTDARVVMPVSAHTSRKSRLSSGFTLSVNAAQSGSTIKKLPFWGSLIMEFIPLLIVISQYLPLVSSPTR